MNTTRCRTHGLKSGACRRPETERQGLPMRPSHDSVRRSESSLHTVGPPVLLNSIIGTPGGRYMRLVTPLRAPFAAPIAPSHRGGLIQQPSSATSTWPLSTVAAGSNLRPPFSIFDLTSGADGWALGSTICILHLLSPHFGPCCCSAICNPQSQSSIFSLEWGTGLEGSTGETWACPCERSARISSLNLLSLPQRSTGLA